MEPRYRRVSQRLYGDARFRRLSAPTPNAQTLWIYLLTGPRTTNVPGLIPAGVASLAEGLGWSVEGTRACLAELESEGMALADEANHVIWLPRAIKHNPPANPNVVRSWCATLESGLYPECEIVERAKADIARHLEGAFLEAFLETFPEAFRPATVVTPETLTDERGRASDETRVSTDTSKNAQKTLSERIPESFPEGIRIPSRIQDQDQDQDQERENARERAPDALSLVRSVEEVKAPSIAPEVVGAWNRTCGPSLRVDDLDELDLAVLDRRISEDPSVRSTVAFWERFGRVASASDFLARKPGRKASLAWLLADSARLEACLRGEYGPGSLRRDLEAVARGSPPDRGRFERGDPHTTVPAHRSRHPALRAPRSPPRDEARRAPPEVARAHARSILAALEARA